MTTSKSKIDQIAIVMFDLTVSAVVVIVCAMIGSNLGLLVVNLLK